MDERQIQHHIEELIDREKELLGRSNHTQDDRAAIADLEVQLDRAWDLLRQRRARQEFGQDPNAIEERPAEVVERYEQ